MSYLEELNPVQREAVQHTTGPAMIIAGAGSGKTRVLTYRIAHLMDQGIDPFNILALTFTNKAAREMRERIEKIVGTEARNLWMGTFHSVFAKILRIEAPKIGYPNNFTIYDTDDAKSLLKTIIKEQNLNDKLYKPNIVYNRISAAKNSLITPAAYQANLNLVSEDEGSGRPKIAYIYQQYWKRCFQAGAMDFDDLLFQTYILLDKFPDVLYKYQNKFRQILIDEYQDTNYAQYLITKKMAAMHENICVVGDDAQSIYGFRGANIQNILNFEKDYPDLKVFKLEQNYRSTQTILNAANDVISKNKQQLKKNLWTENGEGGRIKVFKTISDNEEGKKIADCIFEEKHRNHYKNKDFVILYRTNAQSRAFEEALRRVNIPYRIYGGISFYQRKEIKDLLAYLRLTVNPKDEEALRRVINYPARGIGKTTLEKATVLASEHDRSLWEILENISHYGMSARVVSGISDFITMIKSFQTMLETKNAYDLAMHIAKSSGILKELFEDKSVEGINRYENVEEILAGIKEFVENDVATTDGSIAQEKNLAGYLQDIALLTNADENKDNEDTVSLMTIHMAKGLEFPIVYVVGMEENLLPSAMSMSTREDLEEERRLFYVAITRTREKLFLSYATSRYRFGSLMYNEPSRFLEEIAAQYLDAPAAKAKERNFKELNDFLQNQKKQVTAQPATPSDFVPDDVSELQPGMEVEHQRFGAGKVLNLSGEGKNRIATIFFQSLGQKKIMLKFAKLKVLSKKQA